MKMLPVQLSLNPPLGLWSDVLWRCPPAPPSQLAELKTQLPPSLPSDPRLWGREDVTVFLRFCEREFDLPKVDHDLFQMNGKALCLLTRADFGHRCPGAGDVLHNVLQMLIIESHMMQWHLPNSPVTPTSRYPLSPHSHPPTPTWPPIGPPESPFHSAAASAAAAAAHMHHFMAPNSVTLSPPPSVDSQASSPPQGQDQNGGSGANNAIGSVSTNGSGSGSSSSGSSSSMSLTLGGGAGSNAFGSNHATSNSSNHSDSEEERDYNEAAAAAASAAANSLVARSNAVAAAAAAAAAAQQQQHYNSSPPTTPILKDMPQSLSQQITNSFVNSWSQSQAAQQSAQHGGQKLQQGCGSGGSVSAPTTPSYMQPVKREFFPENSEPNTNGRLLWDFLQQLLNDRNQKYSDLIAWKCRDTGVFKIVDPAGLAKLWGIQKNHLSMNYDKMSRALRYYYRVNILRKVQGERHCYQFLRNPTELKNIKNISLLRQTVAANATTTAAVPTTQSPTGASGNINGVNNPASNNHSHSHSPNTNANCSTNWSHQNMSTSLQQAAVVAAAAAAQQQQQQQQQHSPQRPSSRSNNHNHHHSHHNNNNNNNHMSLPSALSSSAAAAAVAAAAAAGAYGPPPTSPLFMHAINGAFHYLSANGGPPPNSPAALPSTPSGIGGGVSVPEKFQFKLEQQECTNEEMKPTDLSVTGNEKRPYSSPPSAGGDDCYPLIRNADGLTTIKLIRYNESSGDSPPPKTPTHSEPTTPPHHHLSQHHLHPQEASSSSSSSSSGQLQQQQHQQHQQEDEKHCSNTPTPMDSSESNSNAPFGGSHAHMMPTDLRK